MTPRDKALAALKRFYVEDRIDINQLDFSVGYVLADDWREMKATQDALAIYEKIQVLSA